MEIEVDTPSDHMLKTRRPARPMPRLSLPVPP